MYDAARDFSEGLAAVQFSAHHWGFVDKAGTTVIDGPFDVANSFHEGLAAVKDAKTGKWGFIRR